MESGPTGSSGKPYVQVSTAGSCVRPVTKNCQHVRTCDLWCLLSKSENGFQTKMKWLVWRNHNATCEYYGSEEYIASFCFLKEAYQQRNWILLFTLPLLSSYDYPCLMDCKDQEVNDFCVIKSDLMTNQLLMRDHRSQMKKQFLLNLKLAIVELRDRRQGKSQLRGLFGRNKKQNCWNWSKN